MKPEHIKPILFVLAICTSVILFSLPTILYYLTLYTDLWNHFSRDLSEVNKNLSSTVGNSSSMMLLCDTVVSQSIDSVQATVCEPYVGAVCSSYLKEWQQQCLSGGNELNIAVENAKTQQMLEQQITELERLLSGVFPDCHHIAMPYLCLYSFPISNCQSSLGSIPASVTSPFMYKAVTQEECIEITSSVACAGPWQVAINDFSLPDCSSLPHKNSSVGMSNSSIINNEQQNFSGIVSPSSTSSGNITCKEDFILINETCFPYCNEFEDYSHETVKARQISVIVAATIAAMFSATAFVLSLFNRKIMFKFPSIFLELFLLDVFMAALMPLLFAMADPKDERLVCSSMNLIKTFKNPTMFCSVTGAIFHYSFINLAAWWFFYICYFFYEIKFPFHASRMKKLPHRIKPLAGTLITVGFIIPLPPVIISLSSESNKYNLFTMPPIGCMPSAKVWFYSTTLVLSIIMGIGVCLLILIFWIIHKNQLSRSNFAQQSKKQMLTTLEKKMIAVLMSYVVFGTYALIFFGVSHGDAQRALNGLTKYFACESTGHVPGKCDRSGFELHLYPRMSVVAYVFIGIIPISIIIFIVNCHKLWKSITRSVRVLPVWSAQVPFINNTKTSGP